MLPAIAYGLHGPAFGIIHGFDSQSERYHVSTAFDGQRDDPISFQDLGQIQPPCVFVLIPTGPITKYQREEAAREALREALVHYEGVPHDDQGAPVEVPEDMALGRAAYGLWARALEAGHVDPPWGAALTAGYFIEARTRGAAYLKDHAMGWFPRSTEFLERAAKAFLREAEHLTEAAQCLPAREPAALGDPNARIQAAKCIGAASLAHEKAMAALREAASLMADH